MGFKMGKYVAFIIVSCLFFSCSDPGQKQSANTFHINISNGYIESLDPAYAKSIEMMRMVHMLYNTLTETDENLHLKPALAKSWKVSGDGLTYIFHIRNDVFFQDNELFPNGKGRLMTANDVAYSFSRIIDPKVASYGAWIFNDKVDSTNPFVAIDDTTLQIRLRSPFRPLPEILSMPYCSIVPKEVTTYWGKDFRSHPCGTGAFQFKYWDESNVLVMHKNPHYWERDPSGNSLPYLDAVQVTFIDSKATEFLLFMQGKLDFVNGIDGSFKDLVLKKDGSLREQFRKKFQLKKRTYLDSEYLGFLMDSTNTLVTNSPIKNVLVRQAINYAIDRKKIVTYFRNGIGIPACSGFIPAGMPGYDSSAGFGYHYDLQRSLQLLTKAGYPNGKGLGIIKMQTPDIWADIVNFVAEELKEVGIIVQVENIQPNVLKQEMSRSRSLIFRGTWIADYPDAESYLAFFNSRLPAPPNYTRFKNTTFDQWYDESINAPDTIRWKLYRAMDSLAMSYAPVIPLFYDQILHFTQNKVSGFTSNPMNIYELKYVRLKE